MRTTLATLLTLLSISAFAAQDTSILVQIEEPAADDVKSGVANLRGWAITPWEAHPIVRLELYQDGVYRYDIPYGGKRNDVCTGHAYPNCSASGFSMAYNFNNLSTGSHTFSVRAIDSAGDFNEHTVIFSATHFHDPFISNPDSIDFFGAKVSLLRDTTDNIHDKRIYLENVFVNSRCYDLTMNWNTSIQGWRMEDIFEVSKTYCGQTAARPAGD